MAHSLYRTATQALIFGAMLVSSQDWALPLGDGSHICATTRGSCEAAMDAVRAGRWPVARRDAPLLCSPHPGCFSPASECIQGYNCPP